MLDRLQSSMIRLKRAGIWRVSPAGTRPRMIGSRLAYRSTQALRIIQQWQREDDSYSDCPVIRFELRSVSTIAVIAQSANDYHRARSRAQVRRGDGPRSRSAARPRLNSSPSPGGPRDSKRFPELALGLRRAAQRRSSSCRRREVSSSAATTNGQRLGFVGREEPFVLETL